MSKISKSVIDEMARVLQSFGISLNVQDDSFTFYNTDSKKKYMLYKRLQNYGGLDPECLTTSSFYTLSDGNKIRCVEARYPNGSGDMTITFTNGDLVWRLYGDNYPRNSEIRNIYTPIDTPHLSLKAFKEVKLGFRIYDEAYDDSDATCVVMPHELDCLTKDTVDSFALAKFFLDGSEIITITPEGIMVRYYTSKTKYRDVLESESIDEKSINRVIEEKVKPYYCESYGDKMPGISKKIDFLALQVSEVMSYVSDHRDEIMAIYNSYLTSNGGGSVTAANNKTIIKHAGEVKPNY